MDHRARQSTKSERVVLVYLMALDPGNVTESAIEETLKRLRRIDPPETEARRSIPRGCGQDEPPVRGAAGHRLLGPAAEALRVGNPMMSDDVYDTVSSGTESRELLPPLLCS